MSSTRTRSDAEDAVDPIAAAEFYWLHVMNVSLGITTMAFLAFIAISVLREIARNVGR